MASRREYEMLFNLNARLGGSYNSSFQTANTRIASLQQEIQELNKIQSDISAYKKQQDALQQSRSKLEMLRQQYANIQREIEETGTSSSRLQNQLVAKQNQIERTSAVIERQTEKLGRLGTALHEAGVNTDNLTTESAELTSQIEALRSEQDEAAESVDNFGTRSAAALSAVNEALIAGGILDGLEMLREYFDEFAEASIEFETAMTGVDKTTDLTTREFNEMSDSIQRMSTIIPETTGELALIGETAGQLGIAKDGLMDFTEIMAMLGTATDMTSDEAATMLAQFASITGMEKSKYSNLGSTVVELGNSFSTTERNITEMSQTVAAAGSIAGMSEHDIVAISAAVTSLGISSQNGATQMNKLISQLNSAVSSGEDLDKWASVANMSADEFADAWGKDAAQGLDAFIVGLNGAYKSGEDVYSILAELGITETRMVNMITSLTKSGTRLTETLGAAGKAWEENNALVKEAEKRYKTTASLIKLKENAYSNLKVAIGDNYTPALRELYELEADSLNAMAEYIEKNPELVKAFTVFIGVIGTATAGVVAYTAATKIAAAVTALMLPGTGMFMGLALAGAALTATFVGLAEAAKNQREETYYLTQASKEQYDTLQELESQYETTVEMYGASSYEAMVLSWQIEDLSEAYESGKQTLEEYKEAHEELIKDYEEIAKASEESSKNTEIESKGVGSLVSKLKELSSSTKDARDNKQAILGIIDALNESVPELALSYEDVTNASTNYLDSIQEVAGARARQLELEQKWSEYVDRVGEQGKLEDAKRLAEKNAQLAKEQYNLAKLESDAAIRELRGRTTIRDISEETDNKTKATRKAKEELDLYNQILAETTEAYEDNRDALFELEDAFREYETEQRAIEESTEGVKTVVKTLSDSLTMLNENYTESYNSAKESIEGQYGLWDKVGKKAETSVSKVNSNLQGQIDYWQSYNENIELLTSRTADIEGLSDLISSFADGGKNSVSMIAGMASASDTDLKKMVKNWMALKEEQEVTATSLATLEVEFTQSLKQIQEEVELSVSELDLTLEAVESGKNTILGFISGGEQMLPQVEQAYEKLGQAALDAFNTQLSMNEMSNQANAFDTNAYTNHPQNVWMDLMPSVPVIAELEVESGSYTKQFVNTNARGKSVQAIPYNHSNQSPTINVDISNHNEFNGVSAKDEIDDMLKTRNQELKSEILETIEDASSEGVRRTYD